MRKTSWIIIFSLVACIGVGLGLGLVQGISGSIHPAIEVGNIESFSEVNLQHGPAVVYFDKNLSLPYSAKSLPGPTVSGGGEWNLEDTFFWLVTDKTHLRILSFCTDEHIEEAIDDESQDVANHDGIELYFGRTNNMRDAYNQIVVSHEGLVTFYKYKEGPGLFMSRSVEWEGSDRVKIHFVRVGGGYMVDIIIPLDDIGLDGVDEWYFQACRDYRGQMHSYRSVPLQVFEGSLEGGVPNYHRKSDWGRLVMPER